MIDTHCITLLDDCIADAHWRYLVRAGVIKPCKVRTYIRPLVVIGDAARDGRANPVVVRQLRAVLNAAGVRGKGAKAMQLLYDLAVWHNGREGTSIPRRGLSEHMDGRLWGILQRHDEVSYDYLSFDDMPRPERNRLETRLSHRWKTVEQVAIALYAPMKRASNFRRKPKKSFVNVLLQPTRRAQT